jgi:uncharacterized RDD family membrane protein YckC
MTWYYAENNAQAGPVSDDQLRELATSGRIKGTTLVWKAGMDAWTPLAQAVPGLAITSPPAVASGLSVSSDTALVKRPFGQLMPETALCDSCKQFKPLDELVQIAGQRICAQCKPLELQKLEQGESSAHLNYAGFWIRFGGYIMDQVVLAPVSLILNLAMPTIGLRPVGIQLLYYAALIGFGFGYKIFFLGRFGATPGAMIAGLKVVRPDGSAIGYGLAALRCLAEIVSGMILFIGYIMIAFDDQKRALHDRLCNTRVIRK